MHVGTHERTEQLSRDVFKHGVDSKHRQSLVLVLTGEETLPAAPHQEDIFNWVAVGRLWWEKQNQNFWLPSQSPKPPHRECEHTSVRLVTPLPSRVQGPHARKHKVVQTQKNLNGGLRRRGSCIEPVQQTIFGQPRRCLAEPQQTMQRTNHP